jgi:4-hydroxy 2-oxovalerate aldolase
MKITIHDPTLRDGNHAISHSLSLKDIAKYCSAFDESGIGVIEVGHGNGLGASSLQLGIAKHSDSEMLECARNNLFETKLGVHLIPGFAKISDIKNAVDIGVDVFRVAAHCTEADLTQSYISYAREKNKTVHGVLMMTHMADEEKLLAESLKLQSYGAEAIILMDSAGHYDQRDVKIKIKALVEGLNVPVGFHAHNNLGLAVSNSLQAVESGASIVDATMCGFGAGAGNTQLEVLCAILSRYGYETGIEIFDICASIDALKDIAAVKYSPVINSSNLISGMYGICSGFEKHVNNAVRRFNVDKKLVYEELSKANAVAGQEDLIIETASRLATCN